MKVKREEDWIRYLTRSYKDEQEQKELNPTSGSEVLDKVIAVQGIIIAWQIWKSTLNTLSGKKLYFSVSLEGDILTEASRFKDCNKGSTLTPGYMNHITS